MAKRPVFEEVSDPTASSRPIATKGMIDSAPKGARRGIRLWLVLLFVLVSVMIAIGGATRLTDSACPSWNGRPSPAPCPR